jgi:REP element-mobilizing transposase RayT
MFVSCHGTKWGAQSYDKVPRRPRIYFPGAIYHAYDRGVDGQPIFIDDQDRIAFLAMMRRMEAEYSVRIIAYCLMGNHFHFAIQVGPVPLSIAMQRFLTKYCTAFNRRHDRSGHLFGGRHQANLCSDDRYLTALIRYIHMNPVRAGLVTAPGDWAWSSYVPGEEIGSEIVDFDPWQDVKEDIDMTRHEVKTADLEALGSTVSTSTGISVDQLRSYQKIAAVVEARKLFVKDALRNGHTLKSAAGWLKVSTRSASRYLHDIVTLSGPDP